MTETLLLLLAFPGGLLLGMFFYGGLWWTVGKGLASPRPGLWFMASFVLRTTIAVAGFFILSGGSRPDILRLLIALLGLLVARLIMVRFGKRAGRDDLSRASREAGHAA
ncbi:MAG: hypothetical protein ACD_75C00291G0004 [uncultured bacterium]|nr:MAG: hypothetical protein ACD_75C00291G0004 [uncultured bacterium]